MSEALLQDYLQTDKKARQLLSPEQLQAALAKMASAINADYQHKNPVLLCVLNGGMVTLGQLLPLLNFPCRVDSVHASRYRGNTSGAELKWSKKPNLSLKNQHILLVDDILDEGITLYELQQFCIQEGAQSVKSAVLVNKLHQRKHHHIQADYIGCEVEDLYIYGYGMDYKEYGRNKNGIFIAE